MTTPIDWLTVAGEACPYGWMARSLAATVGLSGKRELDEGALAYRGLFFSLDLWLDDGGGVGSLELYPLSPCCSAVLTGRRDPGWHDDCGECGMRAIEGHSVGVAEWLPGSGFLPEARSYLEDWLALYANLDPLEASVAVSDLSLALSELGPAPIPPPRGYADLLLEPFVGELRRALAKRG